MIGRLIVQLVYAAAWLALLYAAWVFVQAGLHAQSAFQENALYAGALLLALLMISGQLAAQGEARRAADAQTAVLLRDILAAATHPENRAELHERVQERRRRREARARLGNTALLVTLVGAVAVLILTLAYAASAR